MVFSSNEFLFFFLTVVLIVYYAVRKNRTLSNVVLTVFSLIFYAWGEPSFVLIMLLSIVLNWLFALGIEKYRAEKILDALCQMLHALCVHGACKQ